LSDVIVYEKEFQLLTAGIEKLKVDFEYPYDQTCCGQPMANSGCYKEAKATFEELAHHERFNSSTSDRRSASRLPAEIDRPSLRHIFWRNEPPALGTGVLSCFSGGRLIPAAANRI
jgi:hypothetical protein